MSTANSLPIQVALPSTSAKANAGVASDTLDADSKGVFGGLLSEELVAATDTVEQAGLKESVDKLIIEVVELPSNGNSLPEDIELPLSADFQVSQPLTTAKAGFGITQRPVADVLRTTDTARVFVENNQNTLLAKPIEAKPVSPVSVLAEPSVEAETLFFTQAKQNNSLQTSSLALIRQGDIDAGKIARVLEQSPELTQRVMPSNPSALSTLLSGVTAPLSESSGLATNSSGVALLSVDVPVQDKRWQKAFAQRVLWSVGNNQSAQLRIHPAELGRIDIQVNVENDKASVVFNTQHGMVKEAIELALPRLREMLAEQGIDLVDVEVRHDDVNQQQADADDNSDEQNALNKGLSTSSSDDDSVQELISHIIVDDDAIDYYV